ncbi:MAG: FkbM family methyltransferase [Saprospiraceae bacterium]|nr:FkbM family methyltransferase [Saprospiraceae bacterium]
MAGLLNTVVAWMIKPLRLMSRYRRFKMILGENQLILPTSGNFDNLETLDMIFTQREYAAYFPFYQKANILDIGAHRGYFSIFAAKNAAAASFVLALEPESENVNHLRKNLNLNGVENVMAEHAALHYNNVEVNLHKAASVNHSTVVETQKGLEPECQKVSGITMDALLTKYKIDRVDFLKMDCEGAEYEIFYRMSADTFRKIHVISMEFHDLKKEEYTASRLVFCFLENGFEILRLDYLPSHRNLNYGRLIARNKSFS